MVLFLFCFLFYCYLIFFFFFFFKYTAPPRILPFSPPRPSPDRPAAGATPHQELITEFGHKRWRLGAQTRGHVVRGQGAGCIARGGVVADRLSGGFDVRGRHPP